VGYHAIVGYSRLERCDRLSLWAIMPQWTGNPTQHAATAIDPILSLLSALRCSAESNFAKQDYEFVKGLFKYYGPFKYVYHLAAYAAEGLSHSIRAFNYRNNLLVRFAQLFRTALRAYLRLIQRVTARPCTALHTLCSLSESSHLSEAAIAYAVTVRCDAMRCSVPRRTTPQCSIPRLCLVNGAQ
jgi:hypothetical protein